MENENTIFTTKANPVKYSSDINGSVAEIYSIDANDSVGADHRKIVVRNNKGGSINDLLISISNDLVLVISAYEHHLKDMNETNNYFQKIEKNRNFIDSINQVMKDYLSDMDVILILPDGEMMNFSYKDVVSYDDKELKKTPQLNSMSGVDTLFVIYLTILNALVATPENNYVKKMEMLSSFLPLDKSQLEEKM